MKTTITEKFDADGKLVERVTVTDDGQQFSPFIAPPFIPAPTLPYTPWWQPNNPIITYTTPCLPTTVTTGNIC